jgi:CHAT domain-containing protein/tetratricopeptide (TPR) repeat protein
MTRLPSCGLQQILSKLLSSPNYSILLALPIVFALGFPAGIRATQQQTQATVPQEDGKPIVLEPGKPMERELKGGEKHTYEIRARAGLFLHAIVDQLGIDVALNLYAPDGKLIASMDSPSGAYGLEQISTIAEGDGIFGLEIASGDKNASAGRYRVSINALHSPTEADRARLSAERTFLEAGQLNSQGNGDSRQKAIQKYESALPLWQAAGDNYEESLTLNSLGETFHALGEPVKALGYFQQALPLCIKAGDHHAEAETVGNIGVIFDELGETQKALEYYRRGLKLQETLSNRLGQATLLHDIGHTLNGLGERGEALKYYERALALERSEANVMWEARTLNGIARVYSEFGEKQKALDYFQQALSLYRANGYHDGEAAALNNIGRVYDSMGEMQKALEYYQQTLSLVRASGNRSAEAVTLNNIALVQDRLGEYQKALANFERALVIERAVDNRPLEATTLANIGGTYDSLGEKQKALDYYNQALPILRAIGDREGEATTLNNIGLIFGVLSESGKALEYFEQAKAVEHALGDRNGEAVTLNNLGKLYALTSKKGPALQSFGDALSLSREVHDPLMEAGVLGNLMEFWRSETQAETAVFFGKQAVNKYQEIRTNIRGLEKEAQRSFLKSKEKAYRELADLLIAQGRLPEAQQVLDLLKNEEYFEFIRRDGSAASSLTAPVTLTKGEESLNVEYEKNVAPMTAIGNEFAALHAKTARTAEEEKHLDELSEQLKAATERFDKFLNDLYVEKGKTREAQARVAEVNERAFGMQRVVAKLGHGTVALYTLVGEEKYRVIVVTPNVMVAREYAIKADELRKKVAEFREALTDPKSNPVPKAQELYRILIGPVEKDLEGAKAETLMWALDDVLRYLPMAALHDGHEYLVEKYRNTVFTPASVPSLAEHANISVWQGLGMGVSKSYGGFSALPAVPEELHRIIREKSGNTGSGILPGQVMLDETFTAENIEKALEKRFPLVHIASHFDFAPGSDTDSFLLLGGKDQQGGHLTLGEIRKDPRFNFTDVELLTLSACNTAVNGAAGDGREVDGLGYVAQDKGARAVVASLWGVYDSSTGLLMQEFYKQWTTHEDIPKAEALRQAQLHLLRGTAGGSQKQSVQVTYAHPYYWAPFILIGNWQ